MCGIMGIGGPRGPALVRQFLPCLAHRGPDSDGQWESPELTLGHRRLAIIGLDEGGRQPMVSRTGRSVITFNGEIYNYPEIADRLEAHGHAVDRRYDTAVLLAALEAWGIDILRDFNGMFAFAWYRQAEKRLILARDRWGKKPLFWGRARLDDGSRVLAFSSELSLFTGLPGGPPEPDPLGVARYMVYDGMPDARTVYRGVEKLPAASWVEMDPEGNRLNGGTFWQFEPNPKPIGIAEAEEQFLAGLKDALRLRLRSDVPVGLFLSGGLDSSLLAAVWRMVRPDDTIRTFTIGFKEPSYDERWSAELMAEAVDAEHHTLVIGDQELQRELDFVWDNLSEPFGDPSIVPTSLLCRFAREHVTVALGGDGADELQAGYDPFRAWFPARMMERILPRRLWYMATKTIERLSPNDPSNMSLRFKARHFSQGLLHPPQERIQGWMASFPVWMAAQALHPDLARQIDIEEILEPTRRAFSEVEDAGDVHAQVATWIRTYLECSILTKVDRASMFHALEVRAPLLDANLTDFLGDLPANLIFRGGKGKFLMRRVAAKLLPLALLRKPKKGFGVPQATWLRTILRERMDDALEQTRRSGWFNYDVINAAWQDHLAGRADYRRALWNFLFSFPFQSTGMSKSRNATEGVPYTRRQRRL
jgi:asparagine synthase (glutamine-hydrolysing)